MRLSCIGIVYSLVSLAIYAQPLAGDWQDSYTCYSTTHGDIIFKRLQGKSAELQLHVARSRTETAPVLTWPLREAEGFDQFSYYDIVMFADHGQGESIQDYACGTRTYDGHNGTDIEPWPFWWMMMDNEQVEVIAAAPGVIIGKDDGNYDRNCSFTGEWNAVYVEHEDGSQAWYGHLKEGTLTTKRVGDNIERGDFIGLVGSSGLSFNPHLHFEIRKSDGSVVDPFVGPCHGAISSSWWEGQKPYREPAINQLYTHNKAPIINGFCPQDEVPNIATNFLAGREVYVGAYFRDLPGGDVTDFEIIDSEGQVVSNWFYVSPGFNFSASYRYYSITIPQDSPTGQWQFTATYQDTTYVRYFNVDVVDGLAENEFRFYPNPVRNQLYVENTTNHEVTIEIVSMHGQKLISDRICENQAMIDLGKLNPGLYIFTIRSITGNAFVSEKLLKVSN